MPQESYFKRKFSGQPSVRRFSGPVSSVEHTLPTPSSIEDSASEETRAAIAQLRKRSVEEMVAQVKAAGVELDPASIKTAVDQYLSDPDARAENVSALRSMTSGLRGMSPDQIAEKLASDARAVFEAATEGKEIPLDNLLIPLLQNQGEIEQEEIDEAAKKRLRGVRLSTKRLKTGAMGATKIAVSRLAIPSAVLVHLTLGIVDTFVVAKAAEGVLSDWAIEGATQTAVAFTAAIGGNVLLVWQKLGVRPEWIRGTADLVWGDTGKKISLGVLTAVAVSLMAPGIIGNAKRGTVDSAVSGDVGKLMKSKYQKEIDQIRKTIDQVKSLFSTIQPSIDTGMKAALKEGGIGWGERTWSRNRAWYGKNEESDRNLEKFKANPKDDTATFRGKSLREFAPEIFGSGSTQNPEENAAAPGELAAAEKELAEAKQRFIASKKDKTPGSTAIAKAAVVAAELKVANIKKKQKGVEIDEKKEGAKTDSSTAPDVGAVERAIQTVNERYGLEPTYGAQQYLQKLTDDLDKINTQEVFDSLASLLKDSDILAKSGILGNIFGVLAPVPKIIGTVGSNAIHLEDWDFLTHNVPWDEMMHSSSGVRAIFSEETAYLQMRNDMAKELKKVVISAMLQKYLDEVSTTAGIDAHLNIPATTFDIAENVTGVDRSPYKLMVDKTIFDYSWPVMPPDDSKEWDYIDQGFKKSGINWVDVKTYYGKRESIALVIGFVLMLIVGSVWYTIAAKKLNKRWGVKEALRDDEKNGLFKVESKLAQDMVRLIQDREKSTLGMIAKGSGIEIPMRDEVALGAILQRRLREHTLSLMEPPLDKTPEGIAFINRENSLESRKLRHAYAAKLNEIIEGYRNDPGGVVAAILNEIDDGRYEKLNGLQGFISATQGSALEASTKKNITDWWARVDARFVTEEVESRKANIQNMYAEREALTTLREPIKITLSGSTPENAVTPADLVYANRLAELDSLIAIQHEAISRITKGTITGRIEHNKDVVFSPEQAQELRDELQEEELKNKLDGADITTMAQQYSALVQGLGKRIGALEASVSKAFGDQATGARVSFDYVYRPELAGPTVEIHLERSDGETLVVPFRHIVPNKALSSDEAIVSAATEWLKPDSKEMRLIRLYAVYDSYAEATKAIKEELLAGATGGVLDVAGLSDDAFAKIQELIQRSEVSRLQKQLIDEVETTGDELNQVQRRVFEEPDKISLGGMWKKDVRKILKIASAHYAGSTVRYDVSTEEVIITDASQEKRFNIRNLPIPVV